MRHSVFSKTILTSFLFTCVVRAEAQSPALSQQYQGVVDQYVQQLQQGGGRGAAPVPTPFGVRDLSLSPAWWTNTNLVAQLGLKDDQKTKIQGIYDNHRQNIASDSDALAKQEAQLRTLLAADPVDHNAVLGQIDRVAQARADLERSNSAMTLEMREVLTAAQWTKLQSQPAWLTGNVGARIITPFGPIANPRTDPGAGQRGQR